MKKTIAAALCMMLLLTLIFGCAGNSLLDSDNPVTLDIWHVYGEQADSPMNRLIKEFNETVGKKKGHNNKCDPHDKRKRCGRIT